MTPKQPIEKKWPIVKTLLSPLTWVLSRVVPKRRSLILFSGATIDHYNESSRYLYEYMHDKPELESTWVTGSSEVYSYLRSINRRVVRHRSLKGLLYYLRAGMVVGTGTTYPSLLQSIGPGTIKICIHHASGPRQTNAGRDPGEPGDFPTSMEIVRAVNRWDYFNFTSKFTEIALGKLQLLLPKRKRILMGYPRSDHLLRKDETLHKLQTKPIIRRCFPEVNAADRVILYAPTWRISNTGMSFPITIFKDFDASGLNQFLREKDAYLLISVHPLVQKQEDFGRLDRILYLPRDPLLDINAILPEISILMSDYSSIVTDFALMDRPLIFVIPDYDEFLYERGLLEDFRVALPGKDCTTQSELVNALNVYFENPQLDTDARRKFLKKYYDVSIQNSCERFYKFISGLIQTHGDSRC